MVTPYVFANEELIQRLVKRFDLERSPRIADPFLFQKIIVPVTSVDELLRTVNLSHDADIASASGWITVRTVPAGKRWHLLGYGVWRTTGATMEFGFAGLSYSGLGTSVTIDDFTPTDSHQGHMFYQPIPMKEAWTLDVYVTTDQAGDKFDVTTLYYEEESYRS